MANVWINLSSNDWPEVRVLTGKDGAWAAIDHGGAITAYTPGYGVASVNYLRALAKHAKQAADQIDAAIQQARAEQPAEGVEV